MADEKRNEQQSGVTEAQKSHELQEDVQLIPLASDQWETPFWLKQIFDGWFDPCPIDQSPAINGLNLHWGEKTYVNPPYSKPLPWVNKAIEENKKGKTIVLLMKMDTSTEWFKLLQEAGAHFLWINGRLRFSDCGKPANFPSMLCVLSRRKI